MHDIITACSPKEHPLNVLRYTNQENILHYIMGPACLNKDKIALSSGKEEITYHDFFVRCGNLIDRLTKAGLSKGDKVAICADKSADLVVLVIASLILGLCYIPIDKSYPNSLIEHIIKNSSPDILIIDSPSAALENMMVGRCLCLSTLMSGKYCNWKKKLNDNMHKASGEDPAYIIYTSGSTGKPKGIIVPHRAVNNHMLWMKEKFSFDHNDVFLLKTPLSFDPSVWEMLLPFYLGAQLVIFPSNNISDTRMIMDCVSENRVTVVQFTPPVLHMFLKQEFQEKSGHDERLKHVSHIFVGGESLSLSTKEMFFKLEIDCKLINVYGPAEATIHTTCYEVRNHSDKIRRNLIGQPIFNVDLYVVNEAGGVCSRDEVGELLIAGANLALGYVDNKIETKKKFHTSDHSAGDIVYRTGDLVKHTADGDLEFIGRSDNQIKVNGVRIELNGLKDFILRDKSFCDCQFESIFNKELNVSSLVCYLIPEKNTESCSDKLVLEMKKVFPSYMIPSSFYVVASPELTDNGKTDLKALKESAALGFGRATKVELEIRDIWNELLPLPVAGPSYDFFTSGGTSITAYILSRKLSDRYRIKFDVGETIKSRTIEEQAKYIEEYETDTTCKHILPLNEEVDEKIFLIHPIGGTVFWYQYLSSALAGKIQIYAISDPGIQGAGRIFNSIEEMASDYCEMILRIKENGPYRLGGASFGSTIAIEVARILRKKGHEVSSIFSFDGWAIYPERLKDLNYFHASMKSQQKEWLDQFDQFGYQNDKLFKVQKNRLDLLFKYKIKPIDFPVTLFKSTEIAPIFQPIDNESNHWGEYCQDLTTVLVSGNHETMFSNENASALAECVMQSIGKGGPA